MNKRQEWDKHCLFLHTFGNHKFGSMFLGFETESQQVRNGWEAKISVVRTHKVQVYKSTQTEARAHKVAGGPFGEGGAASLNGQHPNSPLP